jgi:hypothetical protein
MRKWIFIIAGLILLYMFFQRADRFKDSAGTISTQFRKAWVALTENKSV